MISWTDDELITISASDEVEITSMRRDGTLRHPRIVWLVRLDDDLYVRSVNGPDAVWFRGVQARHEGRIEAGSLTRDVSFLDAEPEINDRIDAAYRAKYGRYRGPVDAITSPTARATTLKVVPR